MSELILKRGTALKAVDEGILEGYANTYSVMDLQGDISNPRSFVKTVNERKSKIKVYKNHDDNLLIGVPEELDPYDPKGLRIKVRMLMDTQLGRDAYYESKFLTENGFDSGFSIGAWVMKRNPDNKAEVLEYKLKEISLLTKEQASPGSLVDTVKALHAQDKITQDEFLRVITKAYDERGFSDDILRGLEKFLSLEAKPDSTSTDEPIKLITTIYNNLI